jgi:hypothetical protein
MWVPRGKHLHTYGKPRGKPWGIGIYTWRVFHIYASMLVYRRYVTILTRVISKHMGVFTML